jgi:hypothetical protein
MATTTRRATIGTVSEGTLRDVDLIGTFTSELRALGEPYYTPLMVEANAEYTALNDNADGLESETTSEIVNDLVAALSEHAPPYCYFGTLEGGGDGACFGFWFDYESLNEASRDGLRLDDGRTVTRDGYIIEISDHGNVEIWEIATGDSVVSVV